MRHSFSFSSTNTVRLLRQAGEYFRTRGTPHFATAEVTPETAVQDQKFMHQVGMLVIEAHDWLPDAPWLMECIKYHATPSDGDPTPTPPGRGLVWERCPTNLFYDIVNRVHKIVAPEVPLANVEPGNSMYFHSQAATCDLLAHWIERRRNDSSS